MNTIIFGLLKVAAVTSKEEQKDENKQKGAFHHAGKGAILGSLLGLAAGAVIGASGRRIPYLNDVKPYLGAARGAAAGGLIGSAISSWLGYKKDKEIAEKNKEEAPSALKYTLTGLGLPLATTVVPAHMGITATGKTIEGTRDVLDRAKEQLNTITDMLREKKIISSDYSTPIGY